MYESNKRSSKGKAEEEKRLPPPRTEEEEQKHLCGLALDLAGKWLADGTAPSQVVVHFLKLASINAQVELEKTRKEIKLLDIKAKSIEAADERDRKYEEVMAAFRSYSGKDNEWEEIPEGMPDNYVDYRP